MKRAVSILKKEYPKGPLALSVTASVASLLASSPIMILTPHYVSALTRQTAAQPCPGLEQHYY